MLRNRFVFGALFALCCWYVFAYPVMRLGTWAGAPYDMGWTGGVLVWLIGYIGMWYSFRGPNMVVRYVVVHWMGMSFILATTVLLAEVPRLIFNYPDQAAAPWILMLGGLAVVTAIIVSHHLAVKRVELPSDKLVTPRRIVQISDVHIGSRQGGFMRRIVNRINQLEPDVVVITGDLIDSSAVGIDALRALESIKAPAFFSIGNHERYADLPKALEMLEQLKVKTLSQAAHIWEDIQLIGVDDADRRDQVALMLPNVEIQPDYFNVLLYHRPVGWAAARQHDVDLMLSGHTHNGQIFPFNWVVRQQFDRIRGLHSNAHQHLYVSSGTGTWGPLMRLGSLNEISCIDLIPKR